MSTHLGIDDRPVPGVKAGKDRFAKRLLVRIFRAAAAISIFIAAWFITPIIDVLSATSSVITICDPKSANDGILFVCHLVMPAVQSGRVAQRQLPQVSTVVPADPPRETVKSGVQVTTLPSQLTRTSVVYPPIAQGDARLEALIDWSNKGLNAATKARIPIAVVAPQSLDPSHWADQPAAVKLSEILQKVGFNIVVDKSEAALIVEVFDADAHSQVTAGKVDRYSEWKGIANLSVRAIWTGANKVLFSEQFPGHGAADNESGADEAARNDALVMAEEQLLTLAAQR